MFNANLVDFSTLFYNTAWKIINVILGIYVVVTILYSIGLFTRKQWVNRLGLISILLLLIFVIYLVYILFFGYHFSLYDLFSDVVLPLFISDFLITSGVLPYIYLNKLHVKEYFKKKPQIETAGVVSSK